MEDRNVGSGGENGNKCMLWASASAVQLTWGIHSFRQFYAGDGRLMPLKAFGIASLFVGASATAATGTISAYGIHSLKDLMEAGANVRASLGRLGISPRARDKYIVVDL